MKAVGLIVEYNPFHNGHLYHLEASKKKTAADVVVCVMSGYFLQRGEPALLPRKERTLMALKGGADLVIELPYIFSSQHANWFARGAVSALHHLGVDVLCFGSEHGNVSSFQELVQFLTENDDVYQQAVQTYIKKGYSYPKATAMAFQKLESTSSLPDLSKPNNILGFHYLKAIEELNSSIKAETIPRKQADFHDETITTKTVASATSIRRALLTNPSTKNIEHTIPASTKQQLVSFMQREEGFYEWERYFPFLQGKILTTPLKYLSSIYEAEEGLERRFYNAIKKCSSFRSFMEEVKTKRYTWTRLQRFAVQILTGTTKEEAKEALSCGGVDHLRVLGMNKKGQAYLSQIKKHVDIPIYTNMPREKTPQQQLNERAALTYYLPLSPEKRQKKWKEDYALPPMILKE